METAETIDLHIPENKDEFYQLLTEFRTCEDPGQEYWDPLNAYIGSVISCRNGDQASKLGVPQDDVYFHLFNLFQEINSQLIHVQRLKFTGSLPNYSKSSIDDLFVQVFEEVFSRYRDDKNTKLVTYFVKASSWVLSKAWRNILKEPDHQSLNDPKHGLVFHSDEDMVETIIDPNWIDMDEYMAEMSELEKLREIVNNLPEEKRNFIILFYYQGFKLKEIAERLGLEGRAVENLKRQSLNAIKRSLKF